MTLHNYLSESKKTFHLAVPLIAAQLLQTSIITIDTIMAGHDSELTLASVAIGVLLWQCSILMMVGICMVVSPLTAHAFGAKTPEKVQHIFQQGIWVSLIVGILGALLTYAIPSVMYLADVAPEIIPGTTSYLHILALSMPFNALFLTPRYLNEGIGNTKILMLVTLASIPINVVGNYIFLNGLLGFPKLGASGIAISSTLSIIFMTALMWLYLAKSPKFKEYHLFKNFSKPDYKQLLFMFKMGLPISISLMMESGMFAAITVLTGQLGTTITAANQIAMNYVATSFMIPLGLSMAITARVGMAAGRGDLKSARIVGISGIIMGALLMMISVVIIALFSKEIAHFYTSEEKIIMIATGLMAIAVVFQISDGIQVCASGALRGLKDTKWQMVYSIIGYWVFGMPLAWYWGIKLEYGAKGLWFGLIIGLSISAIFGTRRFLQLTHPKRNHLVVAS